MIFILIGAGLGLVVLIALQFDCYDWEERIFHFLGGLVLIPVFAFFGAIPALLIGLFIPSYAKLESSVPLATLQDNRGIQGSFFLGTGSIDSEPVYFYIKALPNGGFQQDSIPAEHVVVFQDDTQPRLITYQTWAKTEWLMWLGLPGGSYESEIHVPPGSITSAYKVDAE